ncbi:taurine catabolism dioxygenase TauD ['Osedax' symbiont bacterium Rs2_46_30_T18]|nr:taurine catabolism dioxygenase TauD ['Osedax' symbiont bacterium Rs2_46_30_T18]
MQLPAKQQSQSAWYGSVLAQQPAQWTMRLNGSQVAELATAADICLQQSNDVAHINKANFHLPLLGIELQKVRSALLHGLGFMLINGIDKDQFSTLQLAAMFYGLGAHLGNARMQNAQGHILGHVRDLNLRSDDPKVRIYQTSERQTFHTDSADVVALLCLNKAKAGGESLLVSAVTVFNEMREHYPRLLACLFDPIATDRRGEVPPGMQPYFSIPVFSWYQQHLNVIYQRQYIDSAQRFAGAFKLTATHIEALDIFDQLCNDPKLNLRMQLQPGDMQFVYNHSLLHDRTGFEDYQQPQQRRHLLRLWLSMPGDRELPEVFKQRFGSITVGDRGGMSLPNVDPCAPLQAG